MNKWGGEEEELCQNATWFDGAGLNVDGEKITGRNIWNGEIFFLSGRTLKGGTEARGTPDLGIHIGKTRQESPVIGGWAYRKDAEFLNGSRMSTGRRGEEGGYFLITRTRQTRRIADSSPNRSSYVYFLPGEKSHLSPPRARTTQGPF